MTTVNKTHKKQRTLGSIGAYKILKKLEAGSQATVLLGEDRYHNRVAIKIFKEQKIFRRESKYMQKIGNHSSLITLIDILQQEKLVLYKSGKKTVSLADAIIMEQGKIDLFGIISRIEKFNEKTCRYYFKQLLAGLEHMHKQGAAHCDIKLENIIFDKNGNIKLIDFGLAHRIQNGGFGSYRKLLGTYGYMAPEIHKSEVYNIKETDLFSLGVILFIIVLGSPPFQKASTCDAHYELMQSDKQTYVEFMDSLGDSSDEFKDLILKMLNHHPNKRLTVNQIKSHPWYNGKTNTHKDSVTEVNQALLKDYQQKNLLAQK